MAGGEFCGNASRSFALWAAAQTGLAGRHTVVIETSGISQPVAVLIDTETQTAEIAIPGPRAETVIVMEGRQFPVYVFEGITHIIAENVAADESLARRLVRNAAEHRQCDAAGVMFYDSGKRFMRPAVWVRVTDTLVFESSCGSGSAALGVWAARALYEADIGIELAQPGGSITVHTVKQAGTVTRLSISGTVTLSKTMLFRY
jgi:diaminopimelate epimerase